jgi:hypothetical protein
MLEKHWPLFENKNWGCSLADIDWAGTGINSGKLDYLLFTQGWFHDGHRALADALATLFLLTLPLPGSAQPALAALLACARRPLWAVRAEETAFEQRAALKARGYRWDDGEGRRAKAWWIRTQTPEIEITWLRAEIYRDNRDIKAVHAPATRRRRECGCALAEKNSPQPGHVNAPARTGRSRLHRDPAPAALRTPETQITRKRLRSFSPCLARAPSR